MSSIIKSMLGGAILMAAWTIALFFWTFWRKTRDRLFAWFALAFMLLGLERISLLFTTSETVAYVYLIRLLAYLLLLFAIVDKNRSKF